MLGAAGEILGAVGTKPHQAGGEQGADLAQMRGEVKVELTGLLGGSGLTRRIGGLDRLATAI